MDTNPTIVTWTRKSWTKKSKLWGLGVWIPLPSIFGGVCGFKHLLRHFWKTRVNWDIYIYSQNNSNSPGSRESTIWNPQIPHSIQNVQWIHKSIRCWKRRKSKIKIKGYNWKLEVQQFSVIRSILKQLLLELPVVEYCCYQKWTSSPPKHGKPIAIQTLPPNMLAISCS